MMGCRPQVGGTIQDHLERVRRLLGAISTPPRSPSAQVQNGSLATVRQGLPSSIPKPRHTTR
jgi:hypothetical protein